jgi:hypothetical protein
MKHFKNMQKILALVLLFISSASYALMDIDGGYDSGGFSGDYYSGDFGDWYYGDDVVDAIESGEIEVSEVVDVADLEDIVPDEDMQVVVIVGQREPTEAVEVVTVTGERIPTLVDGNQLINITTDMIENAGSNTNQPTSSNLQNAKTYATNAKSQTDAAKKKLQALNYTCPSPTLGGKPNSAYTSAMSTLHSAQTLLNGALRDIQSAGASYLGASVSGEATSQELDAMNLSIQVISDEIYSLQNRVNAALETCDG